MKEQRTFEEWFLGVYGESFSSRAEYFYDDLDTQEPNRRAHLMKEWLKAAYEAGQGSIK